jgi:hypothetical protein
MKIFLQLICDQCDKIILEKEGQSHLYTERFPITEEEMSILNREHRGHECHIEAVEKQI